MNTDLPAGSFNFLEQSIDSHRQAIEALREQVDFIKLAGRKIIDGFAAGNKLIVFGNGGSASDALHLAAEFVGRFKAERQPLPAIALSENTATITAIGNDYGYVQTFSRQLEAFAKPGDFVIGISTSGNSPNILEAMKTAGQLGLFRIGMTGKSGGKLKDECELCFRAPSDVTARIQELHILVLHLWCEMVDVACLSEARPSASKAA